MLKKITIPLIFLVLLYNDAFSQENESPGTAVYLEIVGKGFLSANVDFPIFKKSRLTLALTMLDHEFAKEESEDEYPTLTLPTPSVMYLRLVGQERHFFEAGLGLSVSPVFWKEYSENDSALSLHGCLGYRFQTPHHFFFRAGFTPFYRVRWAFLPLAGISVGYSW